MLGMENPLALEDRCYLVSGASSGIGRETARLLSRLGARVVLVGRDRGRLQVTRDGMVGDGHFIEVFDLQELDAIPDWMKNVARASGPIAGTVHCAGVAATIPLRYISASHADSIMRINWGAAWSLAKGLRQKAVRDATCSLVFVSSVVGTVGQAGLAAYSSSKGAVVALTKSLAVELASESIRVNCVAPGLVRTEMAEEVERNRTAEQFAKIESMHLLGVGRAIDVSYAAAYLLSPASRWVTGAVLAVDGGYTAH